MDILTFDEGASPPLHRWLSFLRLLMLFNPRVGASRYAVQMGDQAGFAVGWNEVRAAAGGEEPVRYIFIDPKKGLTTDKRPDVPDDQIHVVREEDIPRFERTAACRQVTQLAQIVATQKPAGIDPGWVQERMDILHAQAQAPLRGEVPGVDDRIGQAFARIRDLVNGPDATLEAFTNPISEAVRDCLGFRITLEHSSNILAVLLAHYALSYPSMLEKPGSADLVKAQIDHLTALVSSITRDRQTYDLGSFCQLSYLGLLWGQTALIMSNQLALRSDDDALRRWFKRRALFVEESLAHELAPTLLHPVSYMPFGVAEYSWTQTVGLTDLEGLYAGAGDLPVGSLDPQAVWERVQVYSASAQRLPDGLGPYGEAFCREMKEHLVTFLLTMKLGQARM